MADEPVFRFRYKSAINAWAVGTIVTVYAGAESEAFSKVCKLVSRGMVLTLVDIEEVRDA